MFISVYLVSRRVAVRYPASPAEGFELSSGEVAVVASVYGRTARRGAREAEAHLGLGKDLDVGYGAPL